MSNQNDNRNEIQDRLKQGGKKAVRSANNMVKKAFSKSKNKVMKELGKGTVKLFKWIVDGIGNLIKGIASGGWYAILIALAVALVVFAIYLMYNEGMMTGVMQEFGLIDKEAKEMVILEDKYWQMISDRSYYQEENQYGIKIDALDKASGWAGNKVEQYTPFINWQADASKTVNGKDSSLLPASSFYVFDVKDYKRDYYNRESNYLLPYYLLKELTNTLLQSNEMGKGYDVIYPEQFLKTSYHVNDFMRIDKDGKEFVWVKEDIDGNPLPLPAGSMIYDYKVKEYNPSDYFKAKDDSINYGMVKSYVYNNLSSFDVKKISKDVNDYDSEIQKAADEASVEFELLKAIMIRESGGNPTIGSLKSGYGLFQIENTKYNNSTWTRYSGGKLNVGIQISGSDATKDERSDVYKSALWAGDHLKSLIDRFGGDTLKGLQAYNFGAGGVDILVKEYGEEWINNRDQIARLLDKESHGDPGYLEHVLQYYNGDLSSPSSGYPASSIVRVYYQVDETGEPIIKDDMQTPQMYRQLAPLTDEDGKVVAISENRFNYEEVEYKEVIWTSFDDEMVQDMMSEWLIQTHSQHPGDIQTRRQQIEKQYREDKLTGEEGNDWKLVKEYKDKPISEAESKDFRYEYLDGQIIDRAKEKDKYLEKNSKYAWDSENEQVVYKEEWRHGDVVPDKKHSVKDWGLASNISYFTDRRVEFNSGVYFDEERDVEALEDYVQLNYHESFDEVDDGFYPTFIETDELVQEAQKNLDELEYFNEINNQGITNTIDTELFNEDGEFEGTEEFDKSDINEKIKVYGPFVSLADFSLFKDPPNQTKQLSSPDEYYHFWYDSINESGMSNLFRDVQLEDDDVNGNANLKALKVLDNYEEEKAKVEDRGAIYFSHEQWTEEINLIDKVNTYIGNFLHTYDVKANTKRSLTQNETTAVLEAYVYDRHWKAVSWDVEVIREVTTNKLVPYEVDVKDSEGNIVGTETEHKVELNEPYERKNTITSYFDNTNPNLKFYTNKILKKTEYEFKPDDKGFGKEIFEDGFSGNDFRKAESLYIPVVKDDSYLGDYEYEEGTEEELGYEKSEIIGYILTLKIEDNRNKGKVGYVLRHYSGEIKEVMPQPNEVYLDGQLIEDVKDYLEPNADLLTESERADEIMRRSEYLQDYYTKFEAWVSMNTLDEFNHYDEEVGEVYYEEITTLDRKNIPSSVHSYFSVFENSLEDWNFWTFFKTGLGKNKSEIMLTEFLMAVASYEQEFGSNQPITDEFGQINPKVGFMSIYSNPNKPTVLNATDDITDTKHLIYYELNCSLDENDERLDPIKSINYVSARLHNLTKYYGDLLKGLMAYKVGVQAMDKLIEEHPDTWHSRPADEVFRLMELTMPTDYTENNIYDRYYIQRVLSYISHPDDVVDAMSTDTDFLTESIRSIKHGTGELANSVDKLIGPEYDVYSNYGGYEIENHKNYANFNLTLKKIVGMATGATDINKVRLDLFSLIGEGIYLNGGSVGMAGDLSFFQDLIHDIDEYVLPVQLESPLLTSPFGYRKINHPRYGVSIRKHNGVDIAEPLNTPIYSIADGKVEASGFQTNLGNYVIIKHYTNEEETQFILSVYAHLNNSHPYVKQDAKVQAGQLIGLMGSSGDSTGSHLHFGIKATGITPENENWETWQSLFWEGDRWINPYYFAAGNQSKQLEEKYKTARSLQEAISDYGK